MIANIDEARNRFAAAQDDRSDERGLLLSSLGRTVRRFRAARGLSQQQLAARARLSPRFVTQLEGGRGNISVARLAEVARVLELTAADLLYAAQDTAAPAAEADSRYGNPEDGRPPEACSSVCTTVSPPRIASGGRDGRAPTR